MIGWQCPRCGRCYSPFVSACGLNGSIVVPMSDLTKRMTMIVRVKGLLSWRLRWRLGIFLIRLAAFVIGCGLRVDIDTDTTVKGGLS